VIEYQQVRLVTGIAVCQYHPVFHVGDVIRKLRTDAGIDQRELAKRARMSVTTLSELERGQGNQRRDTIQRLAKALNTNVEDLYASVATMRVDANAGSGKLAVFDQELLERWALLKPDTRDSLQKMIWELTNEALQAKHAKQTA
jgi:transcriptional regulator with XRE-family HTH domain